MLNVTHHDRSGSGSFRLERDGARLGLMTYSVAANVLTILHTEVDPVLRGQGAGRLMLDAAVRWARDEHYRIVPVCPFAKSVFAKTHDYDDVLR